MRCGVVRLVAGWRLRNGSMPQSGKSSLETAMEKVDWTPADDLDAEDATTADPRSLIDIWYVVTL